MTYPDAARSEKAARSPHPITGTWFDFRHRNPIVAWSETAAAFTDDQWRYKVWEMVDAGMDTLIASCVSLHGKAFWPSRVIPDHWPMAAADPVEAVLVAADERGARVFLGLGFFGADVSDNHRATPHEMELRRLVPAELLEVYGHHPSLAGWYLPAESCITGHFAPVYVEYTRSFAANCKQLDPAREILISPYGTRSAAGDDEYTRQLLELEVDIVAYQDEVGVRKTRVDELPAIFERLAGAHRQARIPLWANVEIFDYHGQPYRDPPIAAQFTRVEQQIAAVSPHVEKVICYQYFGFMNDPDSRAPVRVEGAGKLWTDYRRWRKDRVREGNRTMEGNAHGRLGAL